MEKEPITLQGLENLKKELDINIRKRDYLFLHMKNRIVIGLSNVANLVAKNRGKEPKAFTGLSVVERKYRGVLLSDGNIYTTCHGLYWNWNLHWFYFFY